MLLFTQINQKRTTMSALLSTRAAAEYLGIHYRALLNSQKAGKYGDFPAPPFQMPLGNAAMYSKAALDKWIELYWGSDDE